MITTMFRALLILATIIMSQICTWAQDFPSVHFGIEDGLPSNNIYNIYRDSKGFLWIGTDNGIARYNGIRFEKFTTFDGLPANEIFFFQEDYYGRLWLATFNGELCYYEDGVFHNAANTPFLKLPFKVQNLIPFITREKDSSVTIGFSKQSVFVNVTRNAVTIHELETPYNTQFLKQREVNNFTNRWERCIYDNILDIGKNENGGYRISCMQHTADINNSDQFTDVRKSAFGTLMFTFSQDKKFFYDSVYIYNERHEQIKKIRKELFSEQPDISTALKIIYAIGRQFYVINSSGLSVDDTFFVNRKNNLTTITQDKAGNYWVGAATGGIMLLDKEFLKNRVYRDVYSKDIKFSCVRNGNLFFVTDDNNLFSLASGKPVCVYKYEEPAGGQYHHPRAPGYYLDENYKYYYFYGDSHVVIDNVLSKRSAQKKYSSNLTSDAIKGVFKVGDDIMLCNLYEAMQIDYSKIKAGEEIRPHALIFGQKETPERQYAVAQANDNAIWYSTMDGIYRIAGKRSTRLSQFQGISFQSFEFCNDYLVGYDHHNTLVICSNINEKKIKIDTVSNQNCVWKKLYRLDPNHLLISTDANYRLLTVPQKSAGAPYEMITVEDPVIPFQAESICSDGKNCYFFKNGSVIGIDVKTMFSKSVPPELSFSSLVVMQKKRTVKDEYSIAYDSAKGMLLTFSTVTSGKMNVTWQYSISKNDSDSWHDLNSEEINLINPSFGDYTIKVKARTLSSGYSRPVVFKLHIIKPYWATWWFISLNILTLGGFIAWLIRRRVRVLVARRETEHNNQIKFLKSEYKALNALMNPHFIFNTLNNVQSIFNGDNKLAANEYLRIFADLIRQNMHNVSKELIPLQNEIELVINYLLLEKLRFEEKLDYKLMIDENLDLYDIMVPPLLIQPLVENSIKHGILPLESRTGMIHISIREHNHILVMEIKDNGVGLNNSKAKEGSLHESFGLDNIQQRIEQLSIIQNKELTFRMSSEADEHDIQWTVVTVTMPI